MWASQSLSSPLALNKLLSLGQLHYLHENDRNKTGQQDLSRGAAVRPPVSAGGAVCANPESSSDVMT